MNCLSDCAHQKCISLRPSMGVLGDFRLEYEYEIECEYDFSNLQHILIST